MAELLVVDSRSRDGSVDYLRGQLAAAPVAVQYLDHPPGLYESWNYGIAATGCDYIYILTAGESISAHGLRRLASTAATHHCDVVISPPRLVDTNNTPARKHWPVFEVVKALGSRADAVLDEEATLLFAVASMRKSILGSSASNLYRASTLKARPFPTDFGHAGDVGWGLRHAADIRLGVVAETFSTFVLHPRAKQTVAEGEKLRIRTSRETLQRAEKRLSSETMQLCTRLCDAWEQVFASNDERRRQPPFALLRPAGWRAQRERARAMAKLRQLREEAMQQICRRAAANSLAGHA